ncbi:hypothetical protein JTB14_008829 [Gonioctena quinquepunctata]|nr:hypothetical protein JTB14_008829 [Gonioctena quinquepunctata]
MHYGLTIVLVRKLAYEFAKAKQLRYPLTWDLNRMAGKEWLDSFRRRNVNLSLRKPVNTSAARSYGFNRTADHFIAGAPEGSLGVANKSGWIHSSIFLEVLKHIQKKTSCSKDNPILILVDNHESHVTIEAVDYARDVGVFGPFKVKLKIAFNDWHVINPGKTLTIYNIPKLAKIAYLESFNCKNGIWPFNKLTFSEEDFASVQVYHSGSPAGPDVNVQQIISEEINNTQRDQPPISAPAPTSLLSQPFDSPSTSAVGLITPEIIQPHPKVDRNALKKSKKGKLPGKSRIYTDTPEKNRLEEIEKAKGMEKQEQERKQKAKEMKCALNLLSDTNRATKPKGQKKL